MGEPKLEDLIAEALGGRMPSSGSYAEARKIIKAFGLTLQPIHAHECNAWRVGKSRRPCTCGPGRFEIAGEYRVRKDGGE